MTLPGVLRSGRGTPYGYILDTPVPPIKTLPNAPDASVTFFDATTRDLTVRRRGRTIHYIDSPVLCDGTFFMLDGQFTYQGATKSTCSSASRCAAAPAAPRRSGRLPPEYPATGGSGLGPAPECRCSPWDPRARSRHLRHPQQPAGARGRAHRRRPAATPTRSGASATWSATARSPDACTKLISEVVELCLAGNHDLVVSGELDVRYFAMSAGAAARWTLKKVNAADARVPRRPAPLGQSAGVGPVPREPARPGLGVRALDLAGRRMPRRAAAARVPDRPLPRGVLLRAQRRRHDRRAGAARRRARDGARASGW